MLSSLKWAIIYFFLWSPWLWFVALCVLLVLAVCGLIFFRGRLRDAALLACSVLASLLALESLGFWSVSREGGPVTQRTGEMYHWHKDLGNRPGRPGKYLAKKWNPATGEVLYDVTYTVDKNLLRETRTAESGPVIAFFGDSMTFGEGVNDAEPFPQVIAKMSNGASQVFNFAFPGYSPAQFLRAMETGLYDPLIANRELRAFVMLTAAWHTERILCRPEWVKHAPAYAMIGGRVQHQGSCSDGFRNRLLRAVERSAFYRAFVYPRLEQSVSRDELDVYIAVVTEGVRLAQERYRVPTVILYSRYYDEFFAGSKSSDNEIIEKLKKGGVEVVDATFQLEDGTRLLTMDHPLFYIVGDGHYTPYGHKEIANKLWPHLVQRCKECGSQATRR